MKCVFIQGIRNSVELWLSKVVRLAGMVLGWWSGLQGWTFMNEMNDLCLQRFCVPFYHREERHQHEHIRDREEKRGRQT